MKQVYYYYIVKCDNETKEIKSEYDGERIKYADLIKHYKAQGYSKVWVEQEVKAYYNTNYYIKYRR